LIASALQQQPQLWSVLEAPIRVHGSLLEQQQQQPEFTSNSLLTLFGRLPAWTLQQQPTQHMVSMLCSLCKVARAYSSTRPLAAVALSGAVAAAVKSSNPLQAPGSIESSSSSSSSGSLLPVTYAMMARALHCHGWALEQAACPAAGSSSSSSASSSSSTAAADVKALQKTETHKKLYQAAVGPLALILGGTAAIQGTDPATQKQLKQQAESLLTEPLEAAMQGLEAVRAGTMPEGPELQQWA
jgi:hypothetical protein